LVKLRREQENHGLHKEMISKMGERRKWKNVNNEEGRRNYRRLRNELKSHRNGQKGIP